LKPEEIMERFFKFKASFDIDKLLLLFKEKMKIKKRFHGPSGKIIKGNYTSRLSKLGE